VYAHLRALSVTPAFRRRHKTLFRALECGTQQCLIYLLREVIPADL
jgi:hypothetical protein